MVHYLPQEVFTLQALLRFRSRVLASSMVYHDPLAVFYAALFKIDFNQLLIFIEKLSPLLVFEPGTYPVPS